MAATKKMTNRILSIVECINSNKLYNSFKPDIINAIKETFVEVVMFKSVKNRCGEVSRYLCDKINKIEPNSAIVICCRGFWRDDNFNENDLYAYQAHQFVLYQNKYFIDMTLQQFSVSYPSILVRTIEEGHIGCQKHCYQTYPEIIDVNQKIYEYE